jgi:hypothetical protein
MNYTEILFKKYETESEVFQVVENIKSVLTDNHIKIAERVVFSSVLNTSDEKWRFVDTFKRPLTKRNIKKHITRDFYSHGYDYIHSIISAKFQHSLLIFPNEKILGFVTNGNYSNNIFRKEIKRFMDGSMTFHNPSDIDIDYVNDSTKADYEALNIDFQLMISRFFMKEEYNDLTISFYSPRTHSIDMEVLDTIVEIHYDFLINELLPRKLENIYNILDEESNHKLSFYDKYVSEIADWLDMSDTELKNKCEETYKTADNGMVFAYFIMELVPETADIEFNTFEF